MRCLGVVLTLLAAQAWASEEDMRSDACRDALAALQAHETKMAGVSAPPASAPADRPVVAGSDATWRALRAKAARICLGGAPDATPPPRGATSPGISVPSVAGVPSVALPTPRAAPPPLPARAGPPFVTLCDGVGCWTSDGERLPQVGRSPFDARAHCMVQGRFVVCQ